MAPSGNSQAGRASGSGSPRCMIRRRACKYGDVGTGSIQHVGASCPMAHAAAETETSSCVHPPCPRACSTHVAPDTAAQLPAHVPAQQLTELQQPTHPPASAAPGTAGHARSRCRWGTTAACLHAQPAPSITLGNITHLRQRHQEQLAVRGVGAIGAPQLREVLQAVGRRLPAARQKVQVFVLVGLQVPQVILQVAKPR